ncbi:YybH family protein [Micromonospora sp. CPCC 206061]|uniref:YybH family protein n=1 Tax=Micromonospora sp. CPCC 206061 TaxID=3122410 RepID=UPI002FF34711
MTYAQRPEDLHELFKEGVNNKDVDALMALYEPDSLTVGLDGSRLEGEQALRAMLTGLVATIDHLDGNTRKVIVHGDYALMSAAFTGNGGAFSGNSGELARRQPDGGWRFLIDDPTFGLGGAHEQVTSA